METTIKKLQNEVKALKKENNALKEKLFEEEVKHTVKVPEAFAPIFNTAEKIVGSYFKGLKFNPSKGTIDIDKERYVLLRASTLSYEFLNSIKNLYKERGEEEAINIGKNILFDVAHVLGHEDALSFHKKLKLKDPISKLSAGPVHFAYTGWASVDISTDSNPSPDGNFFLKYNHPFSFEADSWIKLKKKSSFPVCIMNSGYSSGWCEASFGIPLTAVEITCRAKGDKECSFIMAPPSRIEEYLKREKKTIKKLVIPKFLERKKAEEELKASEERYRDLLEHATDLIQSVDMTGKILFVNSAWKKTLGYSDAELEDRNIFDFIHHSYHSHCTSMMKEISEGKLQKVDKFELGMLTKNKRTVLLEGNISLKKENGKLVATRSILRNITERKISEERIQHTLEEKEILLKEIHHRVKNNLQIISSLLNLQADTIEDVKAKEKYRESIGRIKSMAIIHELLYQTKNFNNVKADDYLNELVKYISQTYSINKNIDVELAIDIKTKRIDIDKAIPCGLIINELLSNAYKYAFPTQSSGKIKIKLSAISGQPYLYELIVLDNGVGMPESIYSESKTLGMQLVQSLLDQLNGKLEIVRNNGTKFIIQFS
ncbi:MAG: PAS domain S-box protein [Sphingobacteriaceae bacterium]|nr:PAS domain S-box protein [Sphingobacteriaceae bacterium]